ncbi:MocR-like pyridoxine biosynthesis transcription factor PdxR [Phytohalomonas tamaricis]|uniref:MocR-like pyridoxine biosynthesis transcription factor PdxR n=1 Tax=Phytohalomonas tamaricis TaxID=2081032 RepID=UPI000D0B1638|nr:PLP-dependent aminotransferase family protein [Phytohalomonas tamaricis]
MAYHCFQLDFAAQRGLQEQLRETLIDAILTGLFPAEESLPSCRKLSRQLNVSRNTVALVYEGLLDDGYLISRPRSGYYLHPHYRAHRPFGDAASQRAENAHAPAWEKRFRCRPSACQVALKPSNWADYPYPFIYGQLDRQLFPLEQWRETARRMFGAERDRCWISDRIDQDDPALIEQLRTRVLPKRGIAAQRDEILITLGSQNALFLVAHLLFDERTQVAMENPGYPDAMGVTTMRGAQLLLQDVDSEGMCLDDSARQCDYLYVTPSHQVPTGVSMSAPRRRALMAQLDLHDQILIEDDYDAEINFDRLAHPALKSNDPHQRVIYISSLSKSLSPGLRVGYIVADAELIDELRALRRLMYRHPPAPIQQQLAQFLAQGHYDRYLRHYCLESTRRWDCLNAALTRDLPDCRRISDEYASAFWLEAPASFDTQRLAWLASQSGVLIEPGFQHFFNHAPPRHYFRLGFGAIDAERIAPGIKQLAQAFQAM